MLRLISLLLLVLLFTACDPSSELMDRDRPSRPLLTSAMNDDGAYQIADAQSVIPMPASTEPFLLMHEPANLYRFETTAGAMTIWRQFAPRQPTLVLLSNNPQLMRMPEVLGEKVATLLKNGDRETIAAAASSRTPAPLFMPAMVIGVALQNSWFDELAWAVPLRTPDQELSLEKFSEKLADSGMLDDSEVASLNLVNNRIHGILQNSTEFTAAVLHELTDLPQPVIVHIDLSYFQPLYKNEVATPMFSLVRDTLRALQDLQLQTLAVTFSYGHLDHQMSLGVRFLGEVITYLVEDPERFDQPIPIDWRRQREALYLANFFQDDLVKEIYRAQAKDNPEAAWVRFNLYRAAFEDDDWPAAIEFLDQAVALDHIYSLEYLSLSRLASERGWPGEALHLLTKASRSFPHDPFITLQRAQMAHETGDHAQALALLTELRSLPWSPIYYRQFPQYLDDLIRQIRAEHSLAPTSTEQSMEPPSASATDPARQRILHAAPR